MAGNSPEPMTGVSGDISSWICDADDEILPEVEEEMVEKLMHELLKEINGPVPVPGSFPSPAGLMVGESCGPAFSGSGSTVMAGIEMSGGGGAAADFTLGGGVDALVPPIKGAFSGLGAAGFPVEVNGGGANGPPRAAEVKQCGVISMQGGGKEEEMMRMDGYDGVDSNDEDDDEWLTMVLNYPPPELDDWL